MTPLDTPFLGTTMSLRQAIGIVLASPALCAVVALACGVYP